MRLSLIPSYFSHPFSKNNKKSSIRFSHGLIQKISKPRLFFLQTNIIRQIIEQSVDQKDIQRYTTNPRLAFSIFIYFRVKTIQNSKEFYQRQEEYNKTPYKNEDLGFFLRDNSSFKSLISTVTESATLRNDSSQAAKFFHIVKSAQPQLLSWSADSQQSEEEMQQAGMDQAQLQYLNQRVCKMFENEQFLGSGNRRPAIEEDYCSLQSSFPATQTLIKMKDGLWNEEEVFRFISYLLFNRQALKLKLQRRTSKIFKQMAAFIGSRTSVQCRSQNQRLFRKYKNLRNIVSGFKEEYGCQRFEEAYAQISEDPAIRFKTEYQSYVQQQKRGGCQVATQTDQTPLLLPQFPQRQASFASGYDYMQQLGNLYANWVIVPFCY